MGRLVSEVEIDDIVDLNLDALAIRHVVDQRILL